MAPLSPADAEALAAAIVAADQDGSPAGAPAGGPPQQPAGGKPAGRRWGIKGLFGGRDDCPAGTQADAQRSIGYSGPGVVKEGKSAAAAPGPAPAGLANGHHGSAAAEAEGEEARVARALALSEGTGRAEVSRRDGVAAADAARVAAAEQVPLPSPHAGAAFCDPAEATELLRLSL